ncbi:MAG: cob(I)yrinic acid a,c-diamide adenosyltransferase [Bacteriovoracaceae bacterium]|nr:cob(I)yrinic acid a,c-diamide adenosyltransferase [Bacteriovoracaceae bacterium]
MYTKSGDLGETSLASGTRTLKDNQRIEIYGEIDELNSRIGAVVSLLRKNNDLFKDSIEVMVLIQSMLFKLGSHISCEQDKKSKLSLPPLEPKFLNNLEKTIDELDANLPALNNFILPGGSLAASFLHLCRTHTRKIERKLITFHKNNPEEISSFMLQFINRLSDYFFVFARFTNQVQGEEEATYCPRK